MVDADVPGGGVVLGGGRERRIPHTAVALSGAGGVLSHAVKAAAKAVSPARRLSPRQPSPVVIGAPATGDELQVWPRNEPKEVPPGDAGAGTQSPAVPVRV